MEEPQSKPLGWTTWLSSPAATKSGPYAGPLGQLQVAGPPGGLRQDGDLEQGEILDLVHDQPADSAQLAVQRAPLDPPDGGPGFALDAWQILAAEEDLSRVAGGAGDPGAKLAGPPTHVRRLA